MNLPVLRQLKTSSKDGASLKPKMENILICYDISMQKVIMSPLVELRKCYSGTLI